MKFRLNLSTCKRTQPFLRSARYLSELNIELKSDATKDCILIYENKISEEKIMLNLDAKPRKQETSDRKHISEHSVVELVEHIECPYEDPRENLIHHMIQTFQFKTKKLTCKRKIDGSKDKYLLNIVENFDEVYVSNAGNIDWTPTSEDFKMFCKRVKDIDFCMTLREGGKNFKFDEALECEKLWIHDDSRWLDIDNLLARENKMTRLNLNNATEEDVNKILTQWINGNPTVLNSASLAVSNRTSDPVIFKDIAAKEIVEEQSKPSTKTTKPQFKTVNSALSLPPNMGISIQLQVGGHRHQIQGYYLPYFLRNLGIIRWAHNDQIINQEHPMGISIREKIPIIDSRTLFMSDDIVGFPEIGFARKTEMAENKKR
ncbi:unnamed protein product [Caenorhabditis nigoni]